MRDASDAGFVRVSERAPQYFVDGNGTAFIPIGLNLAFPRHARSEEEGLAMMRRWLDRLAENHGNYARIFLGHPFFDIERDGQGHFSERDAHALDEVLDHAWKHGIRLKITLEVFREIGPTPQRESFPGALNFSRPSYHVDFGGSFHSMDEFLESPRGRSHFLKKLDWLSARYADHPGILGWDLWNEMNAVQSTKWLDWTRVMLPAMKQRFPRHLVMQNLGSMDAPSALADYAAVMPMVGNEVTQAHRYLDLGAELSICHGAMDTILSDAVNTLRTLAPDRPALLSEGGAVEPRHIRPWDAYARDRAGTILHDTLFAPFFSGSAGSGCPWHWQEYVDPGDLWWHFRRFARALHGVDPVAEQFDPSLSSIGDMRIYTLMGRTTRLIWCRDGAADWKSEIVEGREPRWVGGARLPVPDTRSVTACAYDPWTDREYENLPISNREIQLPGFQRSLVVCVRSSADLG